MKRALAALAALPLLAYAADVFTQNRLDRGAFQQSVVESAAEGRAQPQLPPALKAIPPAQRAAVVHGIFQALRAFAGSPAFRDAYAGLRRQRTPEAPAAAQGDDAIKAQQRAEADQNYQQSLQALAQLPAAQQGQLKQTLEQLHAQQLKLIDSGQTVQAVRAQGQADQADYQKALAALPPADPKIGLRKALQDFLDQLSDVDFNAQLTEGRRFANPTYEQKSQLWKVAYRGGREATEAARAEARDWLSALQ